MRVFNAAAQAVREQRGALLETDLIWLSPKDWDTGDAAGIGLWRGEDAEDILVTDLFTGVTLSRTFFAGGILSLGAIRYTAGFAFDPVQIKLSAISPAVELAFRGYNARGARIQIWRRCRDPQTRADLGIEPRFKGYLGDIEITRPVPGGEAVLTASAVSSARMLTYSSARVKSDAAQQARSGDRFRRYKGVAGSWDRPWGVEDR